jgi:hypothetical protein
VRNSAALVVLLLMTSAASAQQAYPTRPIRLIVPYPPGGPTDIIGRTINDRLGKRLGQQVVTIAESGLPGYHMNTWNAAHIKSEVARFDTLIKAIGLKAE